MTTETSAAAMLAAHRVCGDLIEDMPDGVTFASWEISDGYVGGQYSTEDSTSSTKRALAALAHRFGLVYSEDPKLTFVQINASGEINGVQVQLWAHVGLPSTEQVSGGEF